MTRYRTAVLGTLAWVLVVTAGATLVWTVISRAGEGVAGDLPTVTTSESRSTRPTESQSASPGEPSGPTGVRRTWQGAAGVVVASCLDAAISLKGAQANSGWKVEVDDTGPDEVRVEFESIDEDSRTRVEGSCVDGRPEFAADTRS